MGLDLTSLRAACAAEGTVIRVVIARHRGSAPRETGTEMLVWKDGQHGTIGGGALEWEACARARAMLQDADPSAVMKLPLGPALGQCCGGAVELVLERFTSATLPQGPLHLRRIAGQADTPLRIARAMRNQRHHSHAMIWQDGWLLEPVDSARPSLWIYGAGHVGRALIDTLDGLPFDVTWIDTAPDRFPACMPKGVNPLIAAEPQNIVAHAPIDTHHLVFTYSHTLDLELCHAILGHGFASLGLIGSATKFRRFQTKLHVLGHETAQIQRIICPIGNPKLGKAPKAIAVGVVADLLEIVAAGEATHEGVAS